MKIVAQPRQADLESLPTSRRRVRAKPCGLAAPWTKTHEDPVVPGLQWISRRCNQWEQWEQLMSKNRDFHW